ncbi:MAG: OmpH family outer membrane protein [Saprospiraceae bacterium]|nr:OmpH family outer membrane protein [Saprospiraceae bacterium]
MKHFLLFFTITFSFSVIHAQKFGYVNTQELISGLASVKLAENELNSLKNELMIKGEEMVKKFEVEYTAYMNEANAGSLSKVEMQKKEEALIAKRDEIQKYEAQMQEKMVAKRDELYQPILDKIKMVIEQIGKEGGYTMIFDTGAGALLHADPAENMLETIKARL